MPVSRFLAIILALGALAGCTVPPVAPGDTLANDGDYVGTSKLVAGQPMAPARASGMFATKPYTEIAMVPAGTSCPAPRRGALMIGDNMLAFSYTPEIAFTVPIGPDGILHAVQGDAVLDGRIIPGPGKNAERSRLVMTITSPPCKTVYSTQFIYNHS